MKFEDEYLLVSECQRGNEIAWAELIDRYKGLIYSLAYRLLHDKGEAEDVLQETFLTLFRSFRTFRSEYKLLPWLSKIAYNICLRRLKRKLPEALSLDEPSQYNDDEYYYQLPDESLDPADLFNSTELRERLEKEIADLPIAYRTVIIMRHIQDLSYMEIAEATNLPMGTVKTYLFRARRMLREKLSDWKKEESFLFLQNPSGT